MLTKIFAYFLVELTGADYHFQNQNVTQYDWHAWEQHNNILARGDFENKHPPTFSFRLPKVRNRDDAFSSFCTWKQTNIILLKRINRMSRIETVE